MNTVARRIREKVTNVQEFTITEEIFCEAVRKRKNWSAPGLAGIQNFWWKKLRGSWKAVVMCFKRWVEQPDTIPEWVTEGRTIYYQSLKIYVAREITVQLHVLILVINYLQA